MSKLSYRITSYFKISPKQVSRLNARLKEGKIYLDEIWGIIKDIGPDMTVEEFQLLSGEYLSLKQQLDNMESNHRETKNFLFLGDSYQEAKDRLKKYMADLSKTETKARNASITALIAKQAASSTAGGQAKRPFASPQVVGDQTQSSAALPAYVGNGNHITVNNYITKNDGILSGAGNLKIMKPIMIDTTSNAMEYRRSDNVANVLPPLCETADSSTTSEIEPTEGDGSAESFKYGVIASFKNDDDATLVGSNTSLPLWDDIFPGGIPESDVELKAPELKPLEDISLDINKT